MSANVADDRRRRDEARQAVERNARNTAGIRVPRQPVDVHESRHCRIGVVGHVGGTGGQLPHQPRVDRADERATCTCLRVGKKPSRFCRRLVRCEADAVVCVGRHALADRAQVLPAETGCDGFARLCVPGHRRCALVGDPDSGDVTLRVALHETLRRTDGRVEHRLWVELDESGERDRRWVGNLLDVDDGARIVDECGAQTAGADVDDENVGLHRRSLPFVSRRATGRVSRPIFADRYPAIRR